MPFPSNPTRKSGFAIFSRRVASKWKLSQRPHRRPVLRPNQLLHRPKSPSRHPLRNRHRENQPSKARHRRRPKEKNPNRALHRPNQPHNRQALQRLPPEWRHPRQLRKRSIIGSFSANMTREIRSLFKNPERKRRRTSYKPQAAGAACIGST